MNILITNGKIRINISKNEYKALFDANLKLNKSKKVLKLLLTYFIPKSKIIAEKFTVINLKYKYCDRYSIILKPNKAMLYCYKSCTLEKVHNSLKKVQEKQSTENALYYKNGMYYLLTDIKIPNTVCIYGKYIKNILEEYTKLISNNAVAEVLPLL